MSLCFHLALHQHGHVHEHVVKLSDAVFQLDDLVVPRFDLVHGLLGDVVHDDLAVRSKEGSREMDLAGRTADPPSLTPEVKMAGLSLSSMLSSSSFVVFLPAKSQQ